MAGIRRGEPWGEPAAGAPSHRVQGDDADLAATVEAAAREALVAFDPAPASDLARAVGRVAGTPESGVALPLDVLRLGDGSPAVNALVLGTAPDRVTLRTRAVALEVSVDGRPWWSGPATTVVVATGQYLHGLDVVPRGHPGDGRLEVQVYALRAGERRAMRARLASGTHVPHPRIRTGRGTTVAVRAARGLPLEVDGHRRDPAAQVRVGIEPGAYRLLV